MAYASVEELAAELGITLTAANTPRLQQCLDAAAVEIDHSVDAREGSPLSADDPLAGRVNLVRGVEWWKSSAAAFGVVGFEETGTLRAPRDGFNRHAKSLLPLKQQFGVA